jgi:RHS repeat-associated protein
MPGRKYSQANSKYRYGFNGKEKADEITSDGYDFGARIYDGRLGRWMSVDLITKAFISPYNFAANSPIQLVDPDGADEIHFFYVYDNSAGLLSLSKVTKWAVIIKNGEPDIFIHHKFSITSDENQVNKPNSIQEMKASKLG